MRETAIQSTTKHRVSSRHIVRDDYLKQVGITCAEAALIAGVSGRAVEKWIFIRQVTRCATRGSYKIDQAEQWIFLRKGLK